DGFVAAKVDHLAGGLGTIKQTDHRRNNIRYIREAPGLLARSINLDRLVLQCFADETRDDHSVIASLPRADGVEKAADHHRQSKLGVIGEREKLIYHFAASVAPAGETRRTQHDITLFFERHNRAFAVNLAARSQKYPF